MLALVLVVAMVLHLVAVVAARHSAQAGADLAALAAAHHHAWALPGEPCAVAHEMGRRNGITVEECRIDGGDVHVGVARPVRWASGGEGERITAGQVRASARAGPEESPSILDSRVQN
ncbi:flp pilus-assembly TadE/G-like family protein [Hoyosella sp. G463]|uniref:Flp pilus-assembly TadE/G-like family protein n=2 Tax=Lolliginicoccus lacisalsi TaxID=2742202 RepID=A0A927PMX6_9ACTN|nr:flp pilus-assembly TadE/G-like family protein [Lolliginicoccus lacisalsi]